MIDKMTKHKPTLLLALGTTIALMAGTATAYWLMRRVPLSEMPVGAEIVPQNALMTVSVSTNEGQWRKLRQFGTPETQAAFAQNLAQLRDQFLTANGYNYKEDIQPWIGDELTVAFLPPVTASNAAAPVTEPQQQSAVLVLPIADPGRAQKLLTDGNNPIAESTARDYQGIAIRSLKGASASYAFAVLDQRFLVASADQQAIEQVIDTFKGEASIAKTPGYSQALHQVEAAQPFLRAYVNVPVAQTLAAENAVQPIPAQALTPLQTNQGITATVTLEPNGVRLAGVGWLSPESEMRYRVDNRAERMPSLLPATTLMMTSGGNLKQLWQDFSDRSDAANAGAFRPDDLRQGVRSTTGLDLDQDIVAWMNGEFALALLPIAETETNQSAGVLFLVQSSDRRAADAALTKLDQAMSNRYGFKVNEAQVDGQPVVNWVSPFASLSVTRGWLDGNVAFLALGTPLANAILPKPDQTLAEDSLFRNATVSELQPNGHFFVSFDRLSNANQTLPNWLPARATGWLEAIQTIGVTAAIQDERSSRYDVLVQLKKTENPVPLPAPTLPAAEPESGAPSPSDNP
jgi:hypothetical protein